MTNQTRREEVFFSYSRKDKKWLELFQATLKPFIRANQFSVWDDTKIKAGDIWRNEIKQALASAKVAVLLVSTNFLNSDFIAENELPPLLEAAQNEGLRILLVVVGHSLFEETELGRYQAVNDPSRPLASISAANREKDIVRICKEIKSAVLEITAEQGHVGTQDAREEKESTQAINIQSLPIATANNPLEVVLTPVIECLLTGVDHAAKIDHYDLRVAVRNDGNTAMNNYRVDVDIPNSYTNQSTLYVAEVPNRRTAQRRIFRMTRDSHGGAILYQGDTSPQLLLDFLITEKQYKEGVRDSIFISIFANDHLSSKKEYPIASMLNRERFQQLNGGGAH